MKRFLALILCVALCLSLAACGSGSSASGGGSSTGTQEGTVSGEIEILLHKVEINEIMNTMIAEFNKEYPDVKVVLNAPGDTSTVLQARAVANDTEILWDELQRTGILFCPKYVEDSSEGWWRYRVPGLGQIDWKKLIDRLREAGFDGTISIEHEDPIWSGSQEKVKEGLVRGLRHIQSCL
ncbi:hypothetical protein [Gemmiger formicilis]|uniref:hypothetical protein n=1 Tax=Gemmiger formicilis TaxID=745368 RepID=UPI001FAFEC18|nr:hypothetical protein [Gemmiger formicilis]